MRFDPDTHTLHAAGRAWQADPRGTEISDEAWITNPERRTHYRRCVVRFESGWAASILWGSGSYSSNHPDFDDGDHLFIEEPATVEVGVLDHTGQLRMRRHIDDGGGDWHDVEAYIDDADLAALLDELATLPTDFDFGRPPPTIEELREAYNNVADAIRAEGRDVTPLPPWPTP